MPHKVNDSRRHKIPKARYRIENWPDAVACLHTWIHRHNGEHDKELGRFAIRLGCS